MQILRKKQSIHYHNITSISTNTYVEKSQRNTSKKKKPEKTACFISALQIHAKKYILVAYYSATRKDSILSCRDRNGTICTSNL